MTTTVARTAGDRRAHSAALLNPLMVWLLGSPWRRLLGRGFAVLRYTAASGAQVRLPVQAARDGDRIVVLAAQAARKVWWRHFRAPAAVEVLVDGAWHSGTGTAVSDDAGAQVAGTYRRRFPRVATSPTSTFVVIDLSSAPAEAPLRGARLFWSWFRTVTAAEFAGFAVPATVGALTATAPAVWSVAALLTAGAVEGAMLGWGQATVLRRARPTLRGRSWIGLTSTAAVLAYAIGLTPSTFSSAWATLPIGLTIGAGAVLGTLLLASIGTAQWWELRHHVPRAWRWILTTAVAWLAGLGVFLAFAMPLWQPGQPAALIVAIGVGGGLLMAATSSAVTGLALARLLPAPDPDR